MHNPPTQQEAHEMLLNFGSYSTAQDTVVAEGKENRENEGVLRMAAIQVEVYPRRGLDGVHLCLLLEPELSDLGACSRPA
jgi:hypothetical protein